MKKKMIHISNELFEWASEYVSVNRIRGPQGQVSLSEFIRRLLAEKRDCVEKLKPGKVGGPKKRRRP